MTDSITIRLKPHELADQFPRMSSLEFAALEKDIHANGLKEPIVRFQGAILDGRHRYEACLAVGVKPRFKDFPGDYAAARAFSTAANLMRRQLKPSQKAMLIAKSGLAAAPNSEPAKTDEKMGIRKASQRYGVNYVTLYKAFYVLERGSPALAEQVLRGELSVGAAEKQIRANKRKPSRAARTPKLAALFSDYRKLLANCDDAKKRAAASALQRDAAKALARAVKLLS